MIKVTLPDGSPRDLPEGATATDLAASIGKRLAKDALVAVVDGVEHDLSDPLPDGARVEIVTPESPRGLFAIRPMLAVSQGRLVALSTPFGTRGWFYEAWRSSERWERFEVPATDCPRISPEFLEEESRTIGAWWFAQEYGCQFMDAESQPFRREDVERAFQEEVQPWAL